MTYRRFPIHDIFQFTLLLVLFFFYNTNSAQDSGTEFKQEFFSADSDSSKLAAFDKWYMYTIVRDLDESEGLLNTMDSLCAESKLNDCRALEQLFIAYFHRLSGNYDLSLIHFKNTYDLYEQLGDKSKMGVSLFNQGVVTSYKGDYSGAVEKYLEAREIYEEVGNINGSINVSNSLGIIYKNIEEYDKSKDSYLSGLKMAIKSDNKSMEAMIHNNIANLYFKQEKAPDSVVYYATKALEIETTLDRNTGIASAYNLISAAYVDKDKLELAIINAEKALEYSKKSNRPRFITIHTLALADIYKGAKQFNKAKPFYLAGLKLADSLSLADYQVKGYMDYAELLAESGNYEMAYLNRLQYEIYYDSINVQESKASIAELETKYETALKDKEINEQKLEINKKTSQRNYLIFGLSLAILFGGSIVWGVVSRMKRNKQILRQESILKEQKISSLEQEKKLLSMSSILEGQESERIRIAKDLHDGLGGLLTSVKAHFGKIQSEIRKIKELDIYSTTTDMIDKAHDEVRRISHNLMPGDLRAGGLLIALEKLTNEVEEIHYINVEFENNGLEELTVDQEVELAIYRITQELLNNIVKYASAKNVFVQVSKFNKEIQLLVEDDGIGFEYSKDMPSSGIGLKSIESRVMSFNGEWDIHSVIGKGTSVSINIPLS